MEVLTEIETKGFDLIVLPAISHGKSGLYRFSVSAAMHGEGVRAPQDTAVAEFSSSRLPALFLLIFVRLDRLNGFGMGDLSYCSGPSADQDTHLLPPSSQKQTSNFLGAERAVEDTTFPEPSADEPSRQPAFARSTRISSFGRLIRDGISRASPTCDHGHP
jgi:hypothetical protein